MERERIIDVTAARRQLGTLLDEVFHKGDTVTIARKGKPLARIVPLESSSGQVPGASSVSPRKQELLKELNGLPIIGIDQDPVEVLRNMRRQRRIRASIEYDK